MTNRFSTGIATLLTISLVSCYPYDENKGKKPATPPAQKTNLTPEQQKLKEQEELKKKEELKKQEELKKAAGTEGPGSVTPPDGPTTPPVEKKRDAYAFANKVPGKEGFVFSPYNNKVVDVRDIPSGTLVQDPTYPAAEKKYFRVP